MKITVVALRDCKICEELKEILDNKEIEYELLQAELNSALCDKLEDRLGSKKYPIVILKKEFFSDVNIHLIGTSSKKEGTKLKEGVQIISCSNLESMLEIIFYLI